MLLSPPHDIPAATLMVGTISTLTPVEDAAPPAVIARRVTPADRALRYLEAGTLGASEPHHVPSRPFVPDLCIASSSLLSVIDPLPIISPLGRGHPFLAIDGSLPHPGGRQSGYPCRSPEPGRTSTLH